MNVLTDQEKRAHDFALKVMELDFQHNPDVYIEKLPHETVIDTKKLFDFYDQTFTITMQRHFNANDD